MILVRSGGWVGGLEEKGRLKLTSAKIEVEVEAELGNETFLAQNIFPQGQVCFWKNNVLLKRFVKFGVTYVFLFSGQKQTE